MRSSKRLWWSLARQLHARLWASLVVALLAGALFGADFAAAKAETPEAGPRVAIALLPGPPPKVKPPMISRLASRTQLAVGFASSTLGSYMSTQTLLDISAGSRTWHSLYAEDLPDRVELRRLGDGGLITSWAAIRRRASSPPAEIVPGSLGQAVRAAGDHSAYVGLEGRLNREAILAADNAGRVERVSIASSGDVAANAVREWRRARFLVARLPGGRQGARALDSLLRARRPQDLVVVLQEPTHVARRLLALGVAGLGGGRDVRSDSTRTDGLVIATDIEPTVLKHLHTALPEHVSGEPIEAGGELTADQLTSFKDRLSQVGPRRWPVVLAGLLTAALLAAAGSARARRGRLRHAGRALFLAALWLPSILLVTGALAPSRFGEIAMIGVSAAVLALVTDRLVPWPRGLAVPAAVTIGSQILDLALGSQWTQRSLLGPNPILGARFYGIGNELEVTLGVIGLLGLGAFLAGAEGRKLIWGFVVGGSVLALLLSWGRLGADVGASLMLAAGTAAAAIAALGERPGRGRLAIVVLAPALGLAALALLDLATGGDAHFTRSVLRAGGLKELGDVAQRRLELSYHSLGSGLISVLVAIAAVALILGLRFRQQLLGPLNRAPGLRAGLYGALVAVIAGALSNDSGPIILLIGTSYLALSAVYLCAAGPSSSDSGARWDR